MRIHDMSDKGFIETVRDFSDANVLDDKMLSVDKHLEIIQKIIVSSSRNGFYSARYENVKYYEQAKRIKVLLEKEGFMIGVVPVQLEYFCIDIGWI